MKIITTNHPIIVNGVKESKPSAYLSADGYDMDVISQKNPIIVNGDRISNPTWYESADGGDSELNVITETHPVIYNGTDMDNPSWYLSADGSRMSKKRASNVERRLAKLNREKSHAQSRIDKINARVDASGKPMGRVDANVVRSLTKQVARIQKTIDSLLAMQSSSFDGDDYYNAVGDDYYNIDQKNTADVKAFQTFANTKGATLKVDGIWGAKTQAEWDKYGATWEATKNPVTDNQAQNIVKDAPKVTPGTTPTANQVADAKKKGLFWDKLKGGWVYAKESGILNWVGNLFGLQPPSAFQPTNTTIGTTDGGVGGGAVLTDDKNKEKGMSKTTKTLLMVGGALVLGFVIYTIAKPKNKGN